MVLKLSVVATSTSMRAGRSERAQTTPESTDTSPDWMPCVITGLSAVRLSAGAARPFKAVAAAEDAKPLRNRRRVSGAPGRMLTAMWPPQSNRGGRCAPFLTATQRLCDGRMNPNDGRQRLFVRRHAGNRDGAADDDGRCRLRPTLPARRRSINKNDLRLLAAVYREQP